MGKPLNVLSPIELVMLVEKPNIADMENNTSHTT